MVVSPVAGSGAPLRPLKVALETRSLDRGGLEAVIASLARGLPGEGIEPVVICTERGGATADRLRRDGVIVEILSGDDRSAELAWLLERHDIQLLNAHYSSLGAPLAATRSIPVVVTLHNAYAWLGSAPFDEIRTTDPQVTAYIAVSQFVADFCSRRFRIEPGRITVVRNGARASVARLDAEARARVRREIGTAADAELVVQIAALSRVKCQLALIDAVAALRDRRPRLVAWLVGPVAEDDYAELLGRRIADYGLAGRVVLVGERPDVDCVLAAADVFVLPSVLEGLSLAAVEALQAGVPAVLTRTGDAAFLLGADGATDDFPSSGTLPGAIVEGPEIDPSTVDWESLRAIAGAEHPEHAPAVARAIAEVIEDLEARRSAAAKRGAALARMLSPEEMCRRTASCLLRVAACASVDRARSLAAELDRERTAAAEFSARVRDVVSTLPVLSATASATDRRLQDVQNAVSATAGLTTRTLEIATRTLDKLRLTHRAREGLRALAARLPRGGGAGQPGARSRKTWTSTGARAGGAVRSDRAIGHESAAGERVERWLILAVVPFDDIGGAQRSAQLARALARRGARVTYAARFPRAESIDLGLCADVERLDLMPWDVEELRAWLAGRDERLRVLVEAPEDEVAAIASQARRAGARVVYDKIDAWESCAWATWFRGETEAQIVGGADDLVASARALQRQLETAGRPVHLVPNAVDRSLFRTDVGHSGAPPDDLACGDVTLVYAGSLWGDWFDWGIVAGVAEARPRWQVNLIGDPPRDARPGLPGNVRFLGLKPQHALPAYYAAADACLIPFASGPVVEALNPLKVYEYLAMHRPVIATPMPELAGLPHVFTAADAPSTVAAVEQAVATPAPVAEIEAFLASNTWDVRAGALSALTARPTVSVVVLCYNNADVIGRCIESLVRFRGDLDYHVAVVDNGSTDGSLDVLARWDGADGVRLLQNERNGCSSGRNLGLRSTAGEIVVFLDSDQWATRDGWLDPALEILREHAAIGAVGWNAGWFDPGSGRGPIVDYLPERGMSGLNASARFRTDVAYLATSGFVSPRAVLARTAGFDEFYDPTCFEDTDLSFQIKALGYELAYCPGIGVDHRPHRTTGALDGYKEYLVRNERYFLEKWRDHPELFLGLPEGG
jgi:glycosyltransferase involved in cell wall biosynthesis/GT2 family glycosyltransferase